LYFLNQDKSDFLILGFPYHNFAAYCQQRKFPRTTSKGPMLMIRGLKIKDFILG
jgi:hypothetical protein